MNAKSFAWTAAAGAVLICAVAAVLLVKPEAPYKGGRITLLYTGDTDGQLESCG
jgi:hypothetical protein